MGTPRERNEGQSNEPILNVRIGRRAFLAGGATALGGLALGLLLGRRSDTVSFDRGTSTAPSNASSTIRPHFRIEGKEVSSPDSEGILAAAETFLSLLFNSTPEKIIEEYTQTKKDLWKKDPRYKEDDLKGARSLQESLKKCGARVEGYNLTRRSTDEQTNVTLSTGENSAYVTVQLDRFCAPNRESLHSVINLGLSRDSASGGTDPNKWKVFGFVSSF